jgi:putative transposase
MPNYRRVRISGGTFFFTVVTYHRRHIFDRPESRDALREVVHDVRQWHPFTIDAWVLLPEHLHCIWTLPKENSDFSLRWGLIKSGFSKRTSALFHVEQWMNDSKIKHRESTIWQRRFWEHQVRNDAEYRAYMDYIHYNPVKHGHVKSVVDWPYSTFHRYVKSGVYPEHWGGTIVEADGYRFGE